MTKSEFVALRKAEFPKILKLLRLYPEDKKDLRPAPMIRSAIELATVFVNEEKINFEFATTGKLDMSGGFRSTPPASMAEAVAKLEALGAESEAAFEKLSDADFQRQIAAFGIPMSLGDALLSLLLDHIHHRGQFTIYSRIAGAKVPQIYGPSADEPWHPPK